jgi:hypothetical protein
MQSKLLFFLVLIPSLCCAASGDNDQLRQVSPPALPASALKAKSGSRNEGTPSPTNPSPRIPLADIQRTTGRSLTPVQRNALEPLGEASNEEDEPDNVDSENCRKYTPPAQFTQRTLSNGSLPLTVTGKPTQATIEEVDED